MIKSYNEEINSRRNKAAIFWFVVFIFSTVLYLFFQGYYLNVDFNINNVKKEPASILKQFGIVNIHVFPNPDNIFINGKSYGNGNKSIFDYGNYRLEIYKKNYIPVQISLEINKNFPIYYESINIFKKFQYSEVKTEFEKISKMDDYYMAFSKNDSIIQILNQNLKPVKAFLNNYIFIGYRYFSNNGQIFVYDLDNNIIKPLIDQESSNIVFCKEPKVLHDRLFCNDMMDFIDGSPMKTDEKVTKINDNVILTRHYIYNNGNGGDWGTYEHLNEAISEPDNLVHLDNTPFILEKGYLYNLENKKKTKLFIPELDEISSAYEFGKETMILGYKNKEKLFMLKDEKKEYLGALPDVDPKSIIIKKINGVYIFNTGKQLFMYYKGGEKIMSILKGDDIKLIDTNVFFKKNGKNYHMSLNQE